MQHYTPNVGKYTQILVCNLNLGLQLSIQPFQRVSKCRGAKEKAFFATDAAAAQLSDDDEQLALATNFQVITKNHQIASNALCTQLSRQKY